MAVKEFATSLLLSLIIFLVVFDGLNADHVVHRQERAIGTGSALLAAMVAGDMVIQPAIAALEVRIV